MIRIKNIQGGDESVEMRKLVVKLGSAVVAGEDDGVDRAAMSNLAASIARLMERRVQVIVVSSGSVGIGRARTGLNGATIPDRQALAAIGQVGLMRAWRAPFERRGIRVAQILLSRDDMADRRRYLNARYTLERLLEMGVVPIINENDTVTIEELKFGDNDELSALVATKMKADMLAILSRVDGLHRTDPGAKGSTFDAPIVEVIDGVSGEVRAMIGDSKSELGAGGMGTKIEAMRMASQAGVHAALANGKTPKILDAIATGTFRGTYMPPAARATKMNARASWLAFGGRSAGRRLTVDAGAMKALIEGKKSLLAVGVTGVEGAFERGDVVEVAGPGGEKIAKGLVNFSSSEMVQIKGLKSPKIHKLLGEVDYDEVIHRDNLAMLG